MLKSKHMLTEFNLKLDYPYIELNWVLSKKKAVC